MEIFFRSASFGTNVAMKVVMGFLALYFIVVFAGLGVGAFFLLKEEFHLEPLSTVNKFLIYYFVVDLLIRYFLQKMPVLNIKPLLTLPIKRSTIIHFTLGKTTTSFFNWMHAFFFIPFSIVLMLNDYSMWHVLLWHIGIITLILSNNFINILINNKDSVFYAVLTVVVGLGLTQYYGLFDITQFTQPFFQGMYATSYVVLLAVLLVLGLYYFAFNYFKSNLNLDEGLAKKSEVAKTENYTWLNQFGTLGTFLKNDIRLLKRNKRSRTTVFMSILFLFYGLLFLPIL